MVEARQHFENKSEYLENVSGYKIIERQKEINEAENSFVVASQIFPSGKNVKRQNAETIHTGYDAFIYYKEIPVTEGKTTTNIEPVIEDNNKMDIVIPQ